MVLEQLQEGNIDGVTLQELVLAPELPKINLTVPYSAEGDTKTATQIPIVEQVEEVIVKQKPADEFVDANPPNSISATRQTEEVIIKQEFVEK